MNLGNIKSGSKIILTEELVIPARNKWSSDLKYPKNLVLSLNSLKINRLGTTLMFQVIRAKAVREKYYKDFDLSKVHPNIRLRGSEAEEFIKEAKYSNFDNEYEWMTK